MDKDPIESAKAIWAIIIFAGAVVGVLFSVLVMGWPLNFACLKFAALVGVVVAVIAAFLVEFIRAMWKG